MTGSKDHDHDHDDESSDTHETAAVDGGTAAYGGPTIRSRPSHLRRNIELIGVALVGVLAAAMIGFIALDWLRRYPGADAFGPLEAVYSATGIDPAAGYLFDQFLIAGEWIDHFLGTEVFQYAFMWRNIATGVLVGVVAPLVGTYLVHRQMALIGETLAHTAFAGVAVGLLFVAVTGWQGSLLYVALVVSVIGALGVQWLTERTNSFGDVPIAIMLTGSFAVGTLLISWGRGFMSIGVDIEEFLFGSLSVVSASGSRLMAALTVGVVAIVAVTYKQLLFITFDEQAARVARLNVSAYNTLLVVMTAVVVVGAMQVLGVILVAGMLVIPVAAASQIAHSFRETLFLSILFGQLSILGGYTFALTQSLPSGGSIIVVAIGIYLAAIAVSDRSGAAISLH
ncbi:metal ABC transporter permease [Natronobacterium gregoryi]|uniref:ABC transporter n=2 Tax=Natronobacterium gregoryi TaxID=44930 RepID=L0ALM8_NATGS|nr:metal ABC transporter permease [Natronobacterium gregoryi]AFZ74359.1 ABC-type Mn2+/Zn2+ transport system, permease component [Natronobacterium gregoryi SP2]ELY63325.1 ABC transporter [Natronobacterium gregoryi SP2]PLK22132.1 metal ABC transporter permease [Natronobacterium gregoryi SP2]SFI54414.1 zinc transport system permease protein [Natronobacterium gregoryi]